MAVDDDSPSLRPLLRPGLGGQVLAQGLDAQPAAKLVHRLRQLGARRVRLEDRLEQVSDLLASLGFGQVLGHLGGMGLAARRGEQRPILETRGRLGDGRDAGTLTTTAGVIVRTRQVSLECAKHGGISSGLRR